MEMSNLCRTRKKLKFQLARQPSKLHELLSSTCPTSLILSDLKLIPFVFI